jgi:Flp pilus assembly protein TadG
MPRPSLSSPCRERGQALVEFAAVLLPLMLIVVGIIQFGLVFNANVTITNAAREGTRAGTIYVYSGSNPATNDQNRCGDVVDSVVAAMGLLSTAAPYFSAASPCPGGGGDVWTSGDVTITYTQPAGVPTNDRRRGYRMTVRVTYRQDIIVPLVGLFLTTDANGRLVQHAEVTMVVN